VTHDREEAMAICDRVAVMRNGCVEQLGTPEEIYIEPASRFVAEFVTQANFVFARRRGKLWETEIGTFDISQFSYSNNKEVNYLENLDSGELAIRQEDLVLKADENGEVVIRDRQFLGREWRYCLRTPSGQELIARTAFSNALPIGTKVKVSLAEPSLRLFPPTSTPDPTKALSPLAVNRF
ncbi:MAG: TOBE domain-containing protein, partial [Okeania sp. SIO2H7]|nr:TOBE domain-containing protein [Okeania sp. SIO2H7]